MAWDGKRARQRRNGGSGSLPQPEKLPPVLEADKEAWRKTLIPADREALREIKRVFPDSELIGIEWV